MASEPEASKEVPGDVSLTWHVPRRPGVMPGWMLCIRLHGEPDIWVTTCTKAVIVNDASGYAVADLTLFTDADGKPIYNGSPVLKPEGDGEPPWYSGTFRFPVTDMRTCRHDGPIRIDKGGICQNMAGEDAP